MYNLNNIIRDRKSTIPVHRLISCPLCILPQTILLTPSEGDKDTIREGRYLFLNRYHIGSLKYIPCLQAVSIFPLLQCSAKIIGITAAIPGLDAYKGSLFPGRRPEAKEGGIKADGQVGFFGAVGERDAMELIFLNNKSVPIKEMSIYR